MLNIFTDCATNTLTLAKLGEKYNYTAGTLHGMLTKRTHKKYSLDIPQEVLDKVTINLKKKKKDL